MFFDFVMIVVTAFAVFGLYSLMETISQLWGSRHSPCSVTILSYSDDNDTYSKIKFLQNNMFNNKIFLVAQGEGDQDIYPGCQVVRRADITRAVENELFTKQKP